MDRVLRDAGLDPAQSRTLNRGAGCSQCHDSGFLGRTGVYEVMEMTPALRRRVQRGYPDIADGDNFYRTCSAARAPRNGSVLMSRRRGWTRSTTGLSDTRWRLSRATRFTPA